MTLGRPGGKPISGDVDDAAGGAGRFPVSVKGVLVRDGRVLLLRNERQEWELPGGKLELGEEPAACVAREITEETGLPVRTGPILDAWQYHIGAGQDVLIVTYGCHAESAVPPVVSTEHDAVGFFTAAEASELNMPAGYKRSIRSWFGRLDGAAGSQP
jgi:8-oxo-dGTP pyrophosphatase MutT (NUDIX family)